MDASKTRLGGNGRTNLAVDKTIFTCVEMSIYSCSPKQQQQQQQHSIVFNPLPDMPILDSSSSAADKNMMSKILTNGGYNFLIEQKTLWEKEKLLFTSNFFFSHNVFKSCQLLMRQNEYLWSKGLRVGIY